MPSATPNAQAASTLPPTNLILVLSFWPGDTPSSLAKKALDRAVKLVTTLRPTSCFASLMSPFSGTCTCSLQPPKPRSRTSSTPETSPSGRLASCSATWSRPVIPRSTRPSPTKVGMSAAGRKINAMSRFLTRAMSRRFSRRNWMSLPARSSRVACCRRPSMSRRLASAFVGGLIDFLTRCLSLSSGIENESRL